MAPCRVELTFWCKRQTTAGSIRNKDTEGYVRRWEALRKRRESWVRGEEPQWGPEDCLNC